MNYKVNYPYYFLDNDQPNIGTSNESPMADVDTVTLTCNEATSESVLSYEWYKDSQKQAETSKTFQIGNTRDKDGKYTCAVKTSGKTSIQSAGKDVLFRCKITFFFYKKVNIASRNKKFLRFWLSIDINLSYEFLNSIWWKHVISYETLKEDFWWDHVWELNLK